MKVGNMEFIHRLSNPWTSPGFLSASERVLKTGWGHFIIPGNVNPFLKVWVEHNWAPNGIKTMVSDFIQTAFQYQGSHHSWYYDFWALVRKTLPVQRTSCSIIYQSSTPRLYSWYLSPFRVSCRFRFIPKKEWPRISCRKVIETGQEMEILRLWLPISKPKRSISDLSHEIVIPMCSAGG